MALIKFDVLKRFSGEVAFTAEIECAEDASTSIKMGLAVRWAIKSRANLSGANLSGANLSGAYLSRADLSRADLSGANLSGADLSGADLSGANLSGADLSRADLSRADLSRAYLSGAYLSGADLSGANLSGANLSGANLSGAYLSGANLSGAYLSGAYLSGAYLSRQWIVQGATRSDGYAFFLQMLTGDKEPMVKAGCRLLTVPQAQKHWTDTRGGTALGEETEAIIRSLVALAKIRRVWPEENSVSEAA